MRLEHSVDISRPVDEVFAYVADVDNLPHWQGTVVEVRKQTDPAVGARHVEVRSFMGKRVEQTVEVTAYEPGRRLDVATVDGPVRIRIGHTFEQRDGGTHIHVTGEGETTGLMRFAEPMIAAAVRAQTHSDFAKLKELLEGS